MMATPTTILPGVGSKEAAAWVEAAWPLIRRQPPYMRLRILRSLSGWTQGDQSEAMTAAGYPVKRNAISGWESPPGAKSAHTPMGIYRTGLARTFSAHLGVEITEEMLFEEG